MGTPVALRKESVDRNLNFFKLQRSIDTSLSARRAWIEMGDVWACRRPDEVALRKESVDRNRIVKPSYRTIFGRSPQGERG